MWSLCGSTPWTPWTQGAESPADLILSGSSGSLKRDPRCPPHQRSRPPRRWPRSKSSTCSEESFCRHRRLHRWVELWQVGCFWLAALSSHAVVSVRSPTSVPESLSSTWTLMPSSRTRVCRRYHRLVLTSAAAHLANITTLSDVDPSETDASPADRGSNHSDRWTAD